MIQVAAAAAQQKQQAMGAGVPGFVPQPLTKAQADELNARFTSEKDAAKQAQMLALIQNTYGKYAGDVVAQAKLPPALVAVAPIVSQLLPGQAALFTAAASAKKEDVGTPSKEQQQSIDNSEYLQVIRAESQTVFWSNEQRNFAEKTANTIRNYVAMGGNIDDIEKNFLIVNDGNMRIQAPKNMEVQGLEQALQRKTKELRAEINEGKSARERMASLFNKSAVDNGFWMFDGKDSFVFMDAASGKNMLDKYGAAVRMTRADIMGTVKNNNLEDYDAGDY
jgi:hypothetical protein